MNLKGNQAHFDSSIVHALHFKLRNSCFNFTYHLVKEDVVHLGPLGAHFGWISAQYFLEYSFNFTPIKMMWKFLKQKRFVAKDFELGTTLS